VQMKNQLAGKGVEACGGLLGGVHGWALSCSPPVCFAPRPLEMEKPGLGVVLKDETSSSVVHEIY